MSSSRWSHTAGSFNAQDRRSLSGMGAFIVLLHLIGFGVLVLFVIPARYDLGTTGVYTVGIGVLAYTFGLRHAFDADHIAAGRQHHPQAAGGPRG